jgi:hypothetical protein
MKITYPNHSDPLFIRAARAVGRLFDRAASIAGWAIVVLAGVFVVTLLAKVAWSFLILTLRAIGEM